MLIAVIRIIVKTKEAEIRDTSNALLNDLKYSIAYQI